MGSRGWGRCCGGWKRRAVRSPGGSTHPGRQASPRKHGGEHAPARPRARPGEAKARRGEAKARAGAGANARAPPCSSSPCPFLRRGRAPAHTRGTARAPRATCGQRPLPPLPHPPLLRDDSRVARAAAATNQVCTRDRNGTLPSSQWVYSNGRTHARSSPRCDLASRGPAAHHQTQARTGGGAGGQRTASRPEAGGRGAPRPPRAPWLTQPPRTSRRCARGSRAWASTRPMRAAALRG